MGGNCSLGTLMDRALRARWPSSRRRCIKSVVKGACFTQRARRSRSTLGIAIVHNILWLGSARTTSNCMIFCL